MGIEIIAAWFFKENPPHSILRRYTTPFVSQKFGFPQSASGQIVFSHAAARSADPPASPDAPAPGTPAESQRATIQRWPRSSADPSLSPRKAATAEISSTPPPPQVPQPRQAPRSSFLLPPRGAECRSAARPWRSECQFHSCGG